MKYSNEVLILRYSSALSMYFFWKRGPLFKSLKRYYMYMYVYIYVRRKENMFGYGWKKMSVMLSYWHAYL